MGNEKGSEPTAENCRDSGNGADPEGEWYEDGFRGEKITTPRTGRQNLTCLGIPPSEAEWVRLRGWKIKNSDSAFRGRIRTVRSG